MLPPQGCDDAAVEDGPYGVGWGMGGGGAEGAGGFAVQMMD